MRHALYDTSLARVMRLERIQVHVDLIVGNLVALYPPVVRPERVSSRQTCHKREHTDPVLHKLVYCAVHLPEFGTFV